MLNIYSPTIQNMYGIPPGTMPTSVEFMNPPVPSVPGDFNPNIQAYNPQAYNYGPTLSPSGFYQVQRDQAANNLRQQVINPYVQVNGYGQYGTYYQPQPTYRNVQGFNPLGVDEMPSSDQSKRMNELAQYYTDKAMESANNMYQNYASSYNYYGYYNTAGIDQGIVNDYHRAKESIEAEAKFNRIDLNKRISRAAHSFRGETVDDETLDKIYGDHKVPVHTIAGPDYNEAMRFANTIDVTEQMRQRMWEAQNKVTNKHNSVIKPTSNIGEYFEDAGMLLYNAWVEKAELQARNRSRFSDDDFRKFVGSQINRREPNSGNSNAFTALMEAFPETKEMIEDGMTEGMSVMEDGTLKIQAPERFGGTKNQVYTEPVVNQEAQHYEQQRMQFINSIRGGDNFI